MTQDKIYCLLNRLGSLCESYRPAADDTFDPDAQMLNSFIPQLVDRELTPEQRRSINQDCARIYARIHQQHFQNDAATAAEAVLATIIARNIRERA